MSRRSLPVYHVRAAQVADVPALLGFARELALGPLLSRYAADPDRLAAELCGLAESSRSAETLLVAVPSEEALGPQPPIAGIALVAHTGMFGSLGGYLKLIAVSDAAQGMGLGSLILSHVEQTVSSHSRDLFLLASHFNLAAHRFYARHGYREVGRLPDYVRPEITEVIFWKRLRGAR